jgi:nucleoside phosphorylase/predicted transcriptional regulator
MDPFILTLIGLGLGTFAVILYFYLKSDDSKRNARELQEKVSEVNKLVAEREKETRRLVNEIRGLKKDLDQFKSENEGIKKKVEQLQKTEQKLIAQAGKLDEQKNTWDKERHISDEIKELAGNFSVRNAFRLVKLILASFFLGHFIFSPAKITQYLTDKYDTIDEDSRNTLEEAERLVDELHVDQVRGKVDFAVVTIRDDEYRAVLERFPSAIVLKGKQVYSIAYQSTYVVAVVRCFEQGVGVAQEVTRDLIADLDPQWIIVVGIAGGVPHDDFSLGDVVVATRVYDLSLEAVNQGASSDFAIREQPYHKRVVTFIAGLAAMEQRLGGWNDDIAIRVVRPSVNFDPGNFYGPGNWRAKVKKSLMRHFKSLQRSPAPCFSCHPIGSSDRLIKDADYVIMMLKYVRQIAALEMESAGIYRAAFQGDKNYPVLAIRGISDIVGFKRDAAWTLYACASAASFARAFIGLKPIKPRNSLSQLLSSSNKPNLRSPAKR